MLKIAFIASAFTLAATTAEAACYSDDATWSGLDQGWSAEDASVWYDASQGSRLIREDWWRALETAEDAPFATREAMAAYGFRHCAGASDPIGFVIDQDDQRPPAIGLTCAACHTGRITDGQTAFHVHGGQAAFDFQPFMRDLHQAVVATFKAYGDPPDPRWARFAAAVLGADHSVAEADALHADLRSWIRKRGAIQRSINAARPWGHGRTDAVQVILNTATMLAIGGAAQPGFSLPPSSAPVSIPHVWNAPRSEVVQWNGSAWAAEDIGLAGPISSGAMIRNISEVVGVFAEIELETEGGILPTYPSVNSSVRLKNLIHLERTLARLNAPRRPMEWGEIDRESAVFARGADLYDLHCAQCHSPLDRDDLTTPIRDVTFADIPHKDLVEHQPFVRLIPAFDLTPEIWSRTTLRPAPGVGTDPMMACNALTHVSASGAFLKLDNVFGFVRSVLSDDQETELKDFAEAEATLRLIEDLALRLMVEKRDEIAAVQAEDLKAEAADLFAAIISGDITSDPNAVAGQGGAGPGDGVHDLTDLDAVRARCAEIVAAQLEDDPAGLIPLYKASPLNGIFASPPYLHNGSVPTLYDVVSPPAERPMRFSVGATVYDTLKGGLGSADDGPHAEFHVLDDDGAVIPGNWNGGHVYPTQPLSPDDRAALVLYLKSL